MPEYALIQNIGRLACLLCHLLFFRRFSSHFVEPGLYCLSSDITHALQRTEDVRLCMGYSTSRLLHHRVIPPQIKQNSFLLVVTCVGDCYVIDTEFSRTFL
jgi:hypothetical protein